MSATMLLRQELNEADAATRKHYCCCLGSDMDGICLTGTRAATLRLTQCYV